MSDKHGAEVHNLPLGDNSDFILSLTTYEEGKKMYLFDVSITYQGKLLAENFLATINFFAIIDAFVKKGLVPGDSNRFFKYAQKSDKHNNLIRSLRFQYGSKP